MNLSTDLEMDLINHLKNIIELKTKIKSGTDAFEDDIIKTLTKTFKFNILSRETSTNIPFTTLDQAWNTYSTYSNRNNEYVRYEFKISLPRKMFKNTDSARRWTMSQSEKWLKHNPIRGSELNINEYGMVEQSRVRSLENLNTVFIEVIVPTSSF